MTDAHITDTQYRELSRQVVQLYDYMERIKEQLAAVKHPGAPVDHFNKVADQLAAIVGATEEATNAIMEATEANMGLADEIRTAQPDEIGAKIDKIVENSSHVFEACTFQDITGQRISKIVETMNLLEGTLNSLIVIIGKDSIAALPVHRSPKRKDGDAPMDGPALEGEESVSQAEIDALFD